MSSTISPKLKKEIKTSVKKFKDLKLPQTTTDGKVIIPNLVHNTDRAARNFNKHLKKQKQKKGAAPAQHRVKR